MTTKSPAPPVLTETAPVRPALTRPLRRLLVWTFPANIGMYLLWGAIPGILLPLQVAAIDEDAKAANLAVVATVGALAAMLAQPLAGAISDRTRSRFGRRGPWIVGGALTGGLALLGLASANTLVQITVAWTITQIAYNFAQGPLAAVMPDRVPPASRGVFSAVTGTGLMLGALGGQVVATRFADDLPAGYLTFAGLALVALTLFVLFNPDQDNRAAPRRPFSLRAIVDSYWFDPRRHPDLGWAFLGRLLLYLGYFIVVNYQLYILQDRVGLGEAAIDYVPVVGVASLGGTVLATVVSGPLSDRLGRRRIFVYAAAAMLATALLLPWIWPTKPGMLAFALLSGLGFGVFQAVDTALITEVLPAEQDFGKDIGVVNIAATLPQVLAPAAAGAIVAAAGYAPLFPVGIALVLLGGLAVVPIKSVR
ncbi:MFS transporter [Catellatospora citrea]|uniref:MFS transporter n=1 Tax=Catellatospora citrea TaxID=53366 RepID=A0A8J3NZC1_9ACTN|nr:MFS transporter [Catellatospora citrea]RKE00453.1 Na+/melibiose symporter-like transporter [Catellatospora citrea]GIF98113.1 MFS transporter [Catellatospora citrea]